MDAEALSQWWLKDDPDKNEITADLLKRRNIDEAKIKVWHVHNRLEKNLRKCGFKPLDASVFRVLFEQREQEQKQRRQKLQKEKEIEPDVTKMTDVEIAKLILQDGNLEFATDTLAALRRQAYTQGFTAAALKK